MLRGLDARMGGTPAIASPELQPMHRRLVVCVPLVAGLLAATGCMAGPSKETGAQPDVLDISGSSACNPLLNILTDAAPIADVEWRYLSSPGSGSAIKGAVNGDLAMGTVSRLLTSEEEGLGLIYTHLSDDAIVFALHPSVGLTDLTTEQVRDIYRGVYTNWSELGGPDLPIVVLDRHEDEPAKMVMRRFVFGDDLVVGDRVAALYTEADIVHGVESTVGSIGYFSLGYGISNGIDVDYPALDGVKPSVATVRDGTYLVTRPLGIVTPGVPDPAVAAFLEWARSDEARDLVESEGYAAAW